MDPRVIEFLKSYSRDDISATAAAGEIGGGANVAEVFVLLRAAGLTPPDPDGALERAEFERAKSLFTRLSQDIRRGAA
ncbi:hypothetical protein RA307_27075 [Xanthobacteraceae bacterium Astr-EGSB]|uniref:hypothetical protein n=1 Tax=Astrobacterium formosum TaxID=3069710 RepID=UPI0027B66339|nr:hypothetical protein [Xanthobacteraceae bacterium Astr-EGSB]